MSSKINALDSRPVWLRLWIAIAVAVFVYRCVSGIALVLFVFHKHPAFNDSLLFLTPWEPTIILVVAMSIAVIVERWQEPRFASKSLRANVVCGVIVTVLALNPLRIGINPELMSDMSKASGTNLPEGLAKTARLEVYVVSPTKIENSTQATDPVTEAEIFLITPAVITAADVATVQRSLDSQGLPDLTVNLTDEGAAKMEKTTTNSLDMQIAIVVNGAVVAVPTVWSTLSDRFRISGGKIATHRDQLFESLIGN